MHGKVFESGMGSMYQRESPRIRRAREARAVPYGKESEADDHGGLVLGRRPRPGAAAGGRAHRRAERAAARPRQPRAARQPGAGLRRVRGP
ncbi:hypothetical protein CDD83_3503 [Cordyceps sp. RAO-2017]|nr:hypothetical protein CDD83_3503 [Cordyceps sp. RAO-2017]